MKNTSANTIINRYGVLWVGGPFYIIKINLSQFEYSRVQIIFQKGIWGRRCESDRKYGRASGFFCWNTGTLHTPTQTHSSSSSLTGAQSPPQSTINLSPVPKGAEYESHVLAFITAFVISASRREQGRKGKFVHLLALDNEHFLTRPGKKENVWCLKIFFSFKILTNKVPQGAPSIAVGQNHHQEEIRSS